ncbi:hypothetical protein C483_06380 [Natrialba hulunbeirensis JCM 10989]|uniref:Uncharacterized protein n=1 Tax=Natrialba hulunbeirensis JCM 10989 TaxID=1227493 RepID=M0A3P0_9EURY|nr:hypothetical protein [Natrialba hulunbeirensis]ELY92936.1 hypothetical protein C483_06380 [Natrialba hulunbeirensis JCM 10989]
MTDGLRPGDREYDADGRSNRETNRDTRRGSDHGRVDSGAGSGSGTSSSTNTSTSSRSPSDPAAAFAHQAQTEYGDAIDRLVAFGDAVQNDRPAHASVELLVGLAEDALDDEIERQLESLGDSIGIEHGIVVSVYVIPAKRFESQPNHPLIQQALAEGQTYV